VSAELRALATRAAAAGLGQQFVTALRELDHILRIYPQFGEPLRDLQMVGETVYNATIPPLFVEYILDEPNRVVFVVIPFKALPHSGFQKPPCCRSSRAMARNRRAGMCPRAVSE
jgi:hypothetical protein